MNERRSTATVADDWPDPIDAVHQTALPPVLLTLLAAHHDVRVVVVGPWMTIPHPGVGCLTNDSGARLVPLGAEWLLIVVRGLSPDETCTVLERLQLNTLENPFTAMVLDAVDEQVLRSVHDHIRPSHPVLVYPYDAANPQPDGVRTQTEHRPRASNAPTAPRSPMGTPGPPCAHRTHCHPRRP